jgi:ABC-2 type transport system ATP-binding protein
MTGVRAIQTDVAVRCRGLVKRYGAVVAVDGVDLEVCRGECFGLLGPNGAGKTTTIEILEGLLAPDAGEVTLLGRSWARDGHYLRERIGIHLQETQLNEKLTVEETLRLFRSFYRDGPDVDELAALVELGSKRRSRVGRLSGGQKQRVAVACALAGRPEVLFLDEPTVGLDPQSRRQLWALFQRFRDAGGTILITTHYMEEAAALCDRVAVMDRGRVIALGTPAALVASLGAEHVIEFAVEPPEAAPPEARLRRLDGVREVRRENGAIRLIAEAPHRAVPALLAELEAHRVRLAHLTTHSATLEDVFVSLTGRHLRDE